MRTSFSFLPALVLLAACGSMQETVQVRDDVYDIPDRTVVASTKAMPTDEPASEPKRGDDYYDAGQSRQYSQGSYYDYAYGDPRWYNRDRFGFGYSSWGPSFGMSLSYGVPYNSWYNSPTGWYDPYWSNSWQSGYGYWSDPYGYYNPWYPGYYYDPFGWSNQYGCGNYYGGGCYGGGYYGGGSDWHNSPIVAHRPPMGGGGAANGAGNNVVPRMGHPNALGLLQPTTPADHFGVQGDRPSHKTSLHREQPGENKPLIERHSTNGRNERNQRTERQDRSEHSSTPGSGGGGDHSGGNSSPTTSPRPRR